MKIKAILYDMGDIFFEAHLWREWMFKEFRKKKLFKGDFAEFYNLYDSFLSKETYVGGKSYEETYDLFLKHMKILEEDIDAFKKKSYKKKVHFEKVMGLYPHVKKTLEAIQKMGVKNIILSDNESTEHEIREKVIGRFGLNEYIDQVISSKDCKCTKSNKKFFSLALKKLKLTANEVLFVAHDQDEIENAQKNKIKAVEYNNYLKIPLYPEYRISKFNQLLNVIK